MKEVLPGWKTRLAGIGLMLNAIVGMVMHYLIGPDAQGALDWQAGSMVFLNGLGFIGAKSAIDKIKGFIESVFTDKSDQPPAA